MNLCFKRLIRVKIDIGQNGTQPFVPFTGCSLAEFVMHPEHERVKVLQLDAGTTFSGTATNSSTMFRRLSCSFPSPRASVPPRRRKGFSHPLFKSICSSARQRRIQRYSELTLDIVSRFTRRQLFLLMLAPIVIRIS